jgi:hypothetical protein
VGIEEAVREVVGERERERDTVGESVKGKVVGIPVLVIDIVGDLVKGKVVGIGERVRVIVLDSVKEREVVPVKETVPENVGRLEG